MILPEQTTHREIGGQSEPEMDTKHRPELGGFSVELINVGAAYSITTIQSSFDFNQSCCHFVHFDKSIYSF